jgi:hypothetical protein
MKFLSIRDLKSKSAEVWKGLKAAIRRSRAVAAVSEIQRRSVQWGTDAITPAEIDAEITAVRRARQSQGNSPH